MAIATITAANLLTKLSVTSVTGLDSIRVTLTSGNEATELASLLNAFNNDTAPMLIGVGLQVRLGDGTTVITFAKDGNGVFKAYNGTQEYTGPLVNDMLNVFNAFYADRLPSIAEINQKLAVDLDGAISDIVQFQTAIADLPDIRNAIGQQDNPNTLANEATGLYAAIDQVAMSATTALEAEVARLEAMIGSNTQGVADLVQSLSSLQMSLDSLGSLVVTSNNILSDKIGIPSSGSGESLTPATGLYAVIEGAVSDAVSFLQNQITDVVNNVTTNTNDIAVNASSISDLQLALTSLSDSVSSSNASILEAIGSPATIDAPATGMFLQIQTAISLMAEGLQSQITALINNAADGNPATTDSIAGLKSALSSLDDLVAQNTSSLSGIQTTLDNLSSQLSGLEQGLSTGYVVAKQAYDAAVLAASQSKTEADLAKNAYLTAASSVTNTATAQQALDLANAYYAKAIEAKTNADNLVTKANAVVISAAQTSTTADDQLLVNAVSEAANAQASASQDVVLASSSVNAATIVLSNQTLDASNQVIVNFIDYSSAAAAAASDISAANTAKAAYESVETTYNLTPNEANAQQLQSAAQTFETAALRAQTTANAAFAKAETSVTAAQTTSSTADDGIASTNLQTATTAKNAADLLATTAQTKLAMANAYLNIPVIEEITDIGFKVTTGADATVVLDGLTLDANQVESLFVKTTVAGFDEYRAIEGAFQGDESIEVSAVMKTMVGSIEVDSIVATLANPINIDTVAPVAIATITAISDDTSNDGLGNTDFETNQAIQTVSGTYVGDLGPGERIQVSVDGVNWIDATATPTMGGGTWTTAPNTVTLMEGVDNILSTRTVDNAGNQIMGGTQQTYTLDVIAPQTTVSGIAISVDNGVSTSDFITSEANQTITASLSNMLFIHETLWGSVDNGATWTNLTSTAVTGTDISWAATLTSGSSTILLEVRDNAGNASTAATQTYTVNANPPSATATITSVTDNVGGVQGSLLTGSVSDDTSLVLAGDIVGTLDAGDVVVVYDGATRLGEAVVTGSTWTYTDETLSHGDVTSYTVVVQNNVNIKGTPSAPAFEVTINTAPVTATVSIGSVTDNVGNIFGSLTTGDATDDTQLVLAGTITGTLEAGEVVAIYDGATRLGNAIVTGSTWEFTDSTLAHGDAASYTAVVENETIGIQGTISSPVFEVNIDTQVPDMPTSVALANDNGTSASDNVSNDGTVNVTLAEANGTWEYTVDGNAGTPTWFTGIGSSFTLNSGSYASGDIQVRQIDAAGNIGNATSMGAVSILGSAPTAPTNVAITPVGGTVIANTLNTTNTSLTATADIAADEAVGGRAELYVGATLVATDSEILGGETSVNFDLSTMNNAALQAAIAEGGEVTVRVYDLAGNFSVSTVGNPTLVVDYELPARPNAVLTTDSGTAGDNYTNDGALTAPSNTEGGAVLEYRTQKDGGAFGAWGAYSAPLTNGSEDGDYVVEVRQTDANGNVSATQTISFTLDTGASAPTITGLANDSARIGTNTDAITNNVSLNVTGLEADAVLQYQINSSGTWLSESEYALIPDGAHSVVVRQIDKAGNASVASNAITFTKDTMATATPGLTFTDNGTSTTDGITNNATVWVSLASDVNAWQYSLDGGNTWNDGVGNTFSMGSVTTTYAAGQIQVRAFDVAGNESAIASNAIAYTLDLTPPDENTAIGINGVSYINGSGLNASNYYEFGDTIRLNFTEKLSAITSIQVKDSTGLVDHSTGLNVFANQTGTTYAQVTLQDDGSGGPFIQAGDIVTIVGVDFVGNSATMTFTMA